MNRDGRAPRPPRPWRRPLEAGRGLLRAALPSRPSRQRWGWNGGKDNGEEIIGGMSKVAEGTKLGGVVGSCRETSINQRWAITLWMKANTGKCWVLLLGWDNPRCTERMGNERLQRKVLNYQSPEEGSEDGEGLEKKL